MCIRKRVCTEYSCSLRVKSFLRLKATAKSHDGRARTNADLRRTPGTVPEEPWGIGIADFNAGTKQSKYGYPILELYQLVKPITLGEMKTTWGMGGPPWDGAVSSRILYIYIYMCGEIAGAIKRGVMPESKGSSDSRATTLVMLPDMTYDHCAPPRTPCRYSTETEARPSTSEAWSMTSRHGGNDLPCKRGPGGSLVLGQGR